jgi:hypothetical protein
MEPINGQATGFHTGDVEYGGVIVDNRRLSKGVQGGKGKEDMKGKRIRRRKSGGESFGRSGPGLHFQNSRDMNIMNFPNEQFKLDCSRVWGVQH